MNGPDLSGRRAIVTGGTRGIGEAVVAQLQACGASVLFTGRDEARGAAVADRTGAAFILANASEAGSPARIVAAAQERLGGVDILVNNAGGPGARDGVMRPDALGPAIDLHLGAAWRLTAAVTPLMAAAGGGSVILMASVAAHRLGALSTAYSVAKAALVHFARCAAAELGPQNIRVNSVSPGFIETDIHAEALGLDPARAGALSSQLGKLFAARQALRIVGQPAHVADAVIFLASDAAAFITGTDLVLDGGVMWGQPMPTLR